MIKAQNIRKLAFVVPPIRGFFRLGGASYLISPMAKPFFLAITRNSAPNVSSPLRLKFQLLTLSLLPERTWATIVGSFGWISPRRIERVRSLVNLWFLCYSRCFSFCSSFVMWKVFKPVFLPVSTSFSSPLIKASFLLWMQVVI